MTADFSPFAMYYAGDAWSPDHNYGPGGVVKYSSNMYMARDYSGMHPVIRRDIFNRNDASSFGTASDGSVWAAVGTDHNVSTIAGKTGVQTLTAGAAGDSLALGAAYTDSADVELLVRWSAASSTVGHTAVGPTLALREDVSNGHRAALLVGLDGSYTLQIEGESDYTAATWVGGARGDIFWTRLRAFGDGYQARTWADGAAEPGTWDLTHSQSSALSAGSVGVAASQLIDDTDAVTYHAFEAFVLPLTPDNNSDQFVQIS